MNFYASAGVPVSKMEITVLQCATTIQGLMPSISGSCREVALRAVFPAFGAPSSSKRPDCALQSMCDVQCSKPAFLNIRRQQREKPEEYSQMSYSSGLGGACFRRRCVRRHWKNNCVPRAKSDSHRQPARERSQKRS